MARLPPTPEDLARGKRLKALREYRELKQADLFKDDQKRTQLSNAENGRNKLNGKFLRELASAYRAPLEVFEAYALGDMSLESFVRGLDHGIAGMGDDYKYRKAREIEARTKSAANTAPTSLPKKVDILAVVKALHELDGLPYDRAVATTQEIELEAGDTFGLYVAARLKIKAERGQKLPGEHVLPGPDVPARKRKR